MRQRHRPDLGYPDRAIPAGRTSPDYQSDGLTIASLFTDQTKATALANPVNTDSLGNLQFFADPGYYVLSFTVGGVATIKDVAIAPWYTDAAWNVVTDITASGGSTFSPASGDCRICYAYSGNATYDLPAATLGTRLRFVFAGGGAGNTVTLSSPGTITWPVLSNFDGQGTFAMDPGQCIELVADGTDYRAVSISFTGFAGLQNAAYLSSDVALPAATATEVVSLSTGGAMVRYRAQVEFYNSGASATTAVCWLGPNSASTTGAYTGAEVTVPAGGYATVSVETTLEPNAATVYLNAESAAATTAMAASVTGGIGKVTGIQSLMLA